MELSLLPTFVAFADTLNFVRAGERLHLSQPAVHLQVRKLEADLGVALYRRRGRALELTSEGKLLRQFAEETRGRTEDFLALLHGQASQRPVVLAAGEGAYLYLLGPAIRSHAGPLRLLTRDGEQTVEAVRSGEADVGVIAVEHGSKDATGLIATTFTTVGSMLVVPRGHPLGERKRSSLESLRGARLVVPPSGKPHREAIRRALLERNVAWEVAVEASGWELAIHFVSLGIGLSIVNACCRLPPSVRGIPISGLPSMDYRILRTARGLERPGTRALTACLVREADAWRGRSRSGS